MGSEFGKGLVICLVKFAEHFMKLDSDMKAFGGRGESHAVHMWANGASDHLYEIEVPEGEDWDEIRAAVQLLKDIALKMGHGFGEEEWNEEDANEVMRVTRKVALMIDYKLGLNSEEGDF